MFSKRIIIQQTQHRNANLTSVFKGLGKADPASAPDLQNSPDIAPITSPAGESALLPIEFAEQKAEKPENAGSQPKFTPLLKKEIEKRIIPDLFIENITQNTSKQNHQKGEVYGDMYELSSSIKKVLIENR